MIAALLLLWVVGASLQHLDCHPTSEERTTLTTMFALAKRHDVAQLVRMGSEVTRLADRPLSEAYRAALYMADHKRFRKQFITGFPVDVQGFIDLGCWLDQSRVAPLMYAYSSLGSLATGGDSMAIRKALFAITDGGVAEYMSDVVTEIASSYPYATLDSMMQMTEAQRTRVICSNLDWRTNKKDFDHFLATRPLTSAEAKLMRDLAHVYAKCSKGYQ